MKEKIFSKNTHKIRKLIDWEVKWSVTRDQSQKGLNASFLVKDKALDGQSHTMPLAMTDNIQLIY